eukprot:scaffold165482_cov36-Tisochrysis_lutea.AAC.2
MTYALPGAGASEVQCTQSDSHSMRFCGLLTPSLSGPRAPSRILRSEITHSSVCMNKRSLARTTTTCIGTP